MARQGITYNEVAEAASQLHAQGRHPTIEQVRIILGTGSSTTIANHLKAWKEAQTNSKAESLREHIPDELTTIVKGLWERVIASSDDRLTAIANDFQSTINQQTQELDKYRQNNRRWQQLYHQLQHEKESLVQARQAAETLIENMREEYALLETKYMLATQQLIEREERQQELRQHLLQTQKNLEQFQETTQQQRKFEQQELSALKKSLHHENHELRTNLDALQHDFNALRLQHHKVVHERDALKNELAIKTAEFMSKVDDRNHLLAESQSQIKFMQQQLAEAQHEHARLREQNELLEKEVWSLSDSKSLLPA